MASIAHFIWVGSLDNEKNRLACKLGPDSLATHSPEQIIKLWVPAESMADASSLFIDKANIEICSIEDKLASLRFDPDTKAKIGQIYADETMPKVAKKDFLVTVILHQEGGYVFDTSCLFYDKPELPDLDPEDFKLAIKESALGENISYRTMFAPDIWAVAASKDSSFTLKSIENNLEIFQNITDPKQKTGVTFCNITEAWIELLTGKTSTTFIEEALSSDSGDYDFDEETIKSIMKHTWVDANQSGPGASHHVDELKLYKFNLGLWRKVPTCFWLPIYQTSYEYLGIELPYRAKLLHSCNELLISSQANPAINSEIIAFLENLIKKLTDNDVDANIPITDKAELDKIIEGIHHKVSLNYRGDNDELMSSDLKTELEKIYESYKLPLLESSPKIDSKAEDLEHSKTKFHL